MASNERVQSTLGSFFTLQNGAATPAAPRDHPRAAPLACADGAGCPRAEKIKFREDALGGILFLRLKASHLRPKHRLFDGSHYALL
jgi:hypothetical protein